MTRDYVQGDHDDDDDDVGSDDDDDDNVGSDDDNDRNHEVVWAKRLRLHKARPGFTLHSKLVSDRSRIPLSAQRFKFTTAGQTFGRGRLEHFPLETLHVVDHLPRLPHASDQSGTFIKRSEVRQKRSAECAKFPYKIE